MSRTLQTTTPVVAVAKACFVRVVFRIRFWAAVGVVAALVSYGALEASTIQGPDGRPLGLGVGIAFALRGMSMLPLVLPLVAGDLLALDIASGYLFLQRARGASVQAVVWGHVLGHAGVAAMASAVVAATGVLFGTMVLPSGVGTEPSRAFPFASGLLESAPRLHVLLMLALYMLAGLALLAVSTGIGAWSGNGLASALLVPIVVLAAGIFMPFQLQAFNPLERVMFANTWGAAWATPDGIATYWVSAAGMALLAALAGLRRREAAA